MSVKRKTCLFPFKKRPDIANKWVQWVRTIKNSTWTPSKSSSICSDHFIASAIDRSTTRGDLNVDSVPTIISPSNGTIAVEACTRKSESPLLGIYNEGSLEKHCGKNSISIPESVTTSCTSEPTAFSTPEVQISRRKSALDQMNTPSTPKKWCGKKGASTPDTSTNNNTELPATDIFSTPEKNLQAESNDKCDVTPSSSAFRVPDKCSTGRRRSLFLHDHNYENTPTTCRRKVFQLRENLHKIRAINKAQGHKIKRLKKRVDSLKELVCTLRKERLVCEDGLQCLDSFSETPRELCMRMIKNRKNQKLTREKYPPELRCFALTLHFYSPKGYDYVRKKFDLALPHPAVLRTWYSSVNAEPGFISESFETLQNRVQVEAKKNNRVICSIMLDEMGIKQGTQRGRDGKQRGHVDLGTGVNPGDCLTEAKDALVIMVVGVDTAWKLPIGYFLISGIDAETQVNLVTESLIHLKEIGVHVTSLTLDGPPSHISTINMLGARIDLPDPRPYFPHPKDPSEKIYVLLDACHMLKLARNCLGEYKVLLDGEGRRIEWKYIVALATLQDFEGLRAGNKLRYSHVNYKKNIMKVRLAAQTLSSSVADAIEFCDTELHLSQFADSAGTVRFLRSIDCIFEFLNVRSPFGKGFKAPLRTSNEAVWRPRMEKELQYLLQLKTLESKPIYKSRRATGFKGLYSGVVAVFGIFDDFVKRADSNLKYLLTYKLSQDHLELFFCAVRQRSGWCPNPTVSQFISAMKRLLIRHEISSTGGNVEEMDNTKILHVSSGSGNKARLDRYDTSVYTESENTRLYHKYDLGLEGNKSVDELKEFVDFAWSLPENTSQFSEHVVGYIAGFIVRKLQRSIKCGTCIASCIGEVGSPAENRLNRTSLTILKSRGGLIIPSVSVIKVCLATEKLFRHACNINMGHPPVEKNFPAVFCNTVFAKVTQDSALFTDLEDHSFDSAPEELHHHVHILIKAIIKAYTELRMYSQTKNHSLAVTGTNIRHFLTRQLVWAHQ